MTEVLTPTNLAQIRIYFYLGHSVGMCPMEPQLLRTKISDVRRCYHDPYWFHPVLEATQRHTLTLDVITTTRMISNFDERVSMSFRCQQFHLHLRPSKR